MTDNDLWECEQCGDRVGDTNVYFCQTCGVRVCVTCADTDHAHWDPRLDAYPEGKAPDE